MVRKKQQGALKRRGSTLLTLRELKRWSRNAHDKASSVFRELSRFAGQLTVSMRVSTMGKRGYSKFHRMMKRTTYAPISKHKETCWASLAILESMGSNKGGGGAEKSHVNGELFERAQVAYNIVYFSCGAILDCVFDFNLSHNTKRKWNEKVESMVHRETVQSFGGPYFFSVTKKTVPAGGGIKPNTSKGTEKGGTRTSARNEGKPVVDFSEMFSGMFSSDSESDGVVVLLTDSDSDSD